MLQSQRPEFQSLRQNSSGPAKLVSPRVQAAQSQTMGHSPANSISTPTGTLGRRKSAFMKPIPDGRSGDIHPEIQQVVGLTLAHSSKIYCSGPLIRRIEKHPDGSLNKDARWVEVWAQLGGTTLSIWEMEAIKKASAEGREEPPTYVNVTDSVSSMFSIPYLKAKSC
jgi:CCR4-NOT transcriptional complex subunit CAF120